ncbi:hypothetical protein NPIL_53661 [Nephila pilipes]|uniref:Uncharacterized protein n=1 Tax=Nephila pilipes TaxID=299642 RepID=A0A8X6TYE8_NEPPI|nr:hypothetical protein NPIL_53661 [Nephila pilipes]
MALVNQSSSYCDQYKGLTADEPLTEGKKQCFEKERFPRTVDPPSDPGQRSQPLAIIYSINQLDCQQHFLNSKSYLNFNPFPLKFPPLFKESITQRYHLSFSIQRNQSVSWKSKYRGRRIEVNL